MISKKEDAWRRDDIWWIHTKEHDIIWYFVLFSVSFCLCKPLQIVHKLTKRKLRRQFSAKILDKCSGSSKGAKGYLSRGITVYTSTWNLPLWATPPKTFWRVRLPRYHQGQIISWEMYTPPQWNHKTTGSMAERFKYFFFICTTITLNR